MYIDIYVTHTDNIHLENLDRKDLYIYIYKNGLWKKLTSKTSLIKCHGFYVFFCVKGDDFSWVTPFA